MTNDDTRTVQITLPDGSTRTLTLPRRRDTPAARVAPHGPRRLWGHPLAKGWPLALRGRFWGRW